MIWRKCEKIMKFVLDYPCYILNNVLSNYKFDWLTTDIKKVRNSLFTIVSVGFQ